MHGQGMRLVLLHEELPCACGVGDTGGWGTKEGEDEAGGQGGSGWGEKGG